MSPLSHFNIEIGFLWLISYISFCGVTIILSHSVTSSNYFRFWFIIVTNNLRLSVITLNSSCLITLEIMRSTLHIGSLRLRKFSLFDFITFSSKVFRLSSRFISANLNLSAFIISFVMNCIGEIRIIMFRLMSRIHRCLISRKVLINISGLRIGSNISLSWMRINVICLVNLILRSTVNICCLGLWIMLKSCVIHSWVSLLHIRIIVIVCRCIHKRNRFRLSILLRSWIYETVWWRVKCALYEIVWLIKIMWRRVNRSCSLFESTPYSPLSIIRMH